MAKDEVTIEKVLGTKDKVKQAEAFLKVLNAPIIDLVIRFDSRSGRIAINSIGGPLQAAAIYKLLDMARDALREEELKAVAEKKQE